ncbi:MAG TPA: helix-turn-helix transcriptional regulator [Pirellulales bacterium]
MPTITEALKRAIEQSGKTPYRIAKDAGISAAMLSRFLAGERDVRLATVDKIAATLGLSLTLKPQRH